MLNVSGENGRDLILSQKMQSLESFLKICNDFYTHLSDVLVIGDDWEGGNNLRWKLMRLWNKYQQILSYYQKVHTLGEEDFNECFWCVQSFLVELGEILWNIINDVEKWDNKMVDRFIDKMFGLNGAFSRLCRNIKEQEYWASYVSSGIDDDFDYNAFSKSGWFDDIFRWYRAYKETNKRLWINVYRPLLELVNKELEILLGWISEKRMILSKEDFMSKSEKLFIMKYLNIKSYKDFCNKYDVLKDKQKELFDLEQMVDECFGEDGKLKPGVKFDNLHMKNLRRFLKVKFGAVTAQRIAKALEKKKKPE